MRKIYLFMALTVDGYFEGPNHDISWHNVDAEFVKFAEEQLDQTDLLMFGHRTYDLMASFWPSEEAMKEDPGTAERMTSKKKLVFSTTMKKADWNNTEVRNAVNKDEIMKLKSSPGKDIAIFGSSNLCISFLKAGLLDEIRVMIMPVVLGKGTSLFAGLDQKIGVKKLSERSFKNGNTLLTYQVVK